MRGRVPSGPRGAGGQAAAVEDETGAGTVEDEHRGADGTDTALPARVLDAVRGGFDNVPDDRGYAKRLMASHEGARHMLTWCERFSADAARRAAVSGMPLVIFGNAGFPRGDQPHHAVLPGTRCAYADGPEAVTSARAEAIAEDGGPVTAQAVTACMTEPGDVMAAVRAAGLAAGPVQVQLGLAPASRVLPGAGVTIARWSRKLRGLPGSQVTILVPLRGYLGLPEVFGDTPMHEAGDAVKWLERAGLEPLLAGTDVRAWGLTRVRGEQAGNLQDWDAGALHADEGTRIVAAAGRVP